MDVPFCLCAIVCHFRCVQVDAGPQRKLCQGILLECMIAYPLKIPRTRTAPLFDEAQINLQAQAKFSS